MKCLLLLRPEYHMTESLLTKLKNAQDSKLAMPHRQDLGGFEHFFPHTFLLA